MIFQVSYGLQIPRNIKHWTQNRTVWRRLMIKWLQLSEKRKLFSRCLWGALEDLLEPPQTQPCTLIMGKFKSLGVRPAGKLRPLLWCSTLCWCRYSEWTANRACPVRHAHHSLLFAARRSQDGRSWARWCRRTLSVSGTSPLLEPLTVLASRLVLRNLVEVSHNFALTLRVALSGMLEVLPVTLPVKWGCVASTNNYYKIISKTQTNWLQSVVTNS